METATPDMATSLAARQWAKLCADRALTDLPYKIETTRSGKLIMSPASFWHSNYQVEIGYYIKLLLPAGLGSVECAIQTSQGVKVADVAWISSERAAPYLRAVCLPVAPEICVEVASPSNTRGDMEEKKRLYFEAGATEVWFCNKRGTMSFFSSEDMRNPIPQSRLCPDFPKSVAR